MQLSPRLKKWLKILLFLLIARIVIGGLLYYLVQHKFVKIVQYIVAKESDDTYHFDADDIDFSPWNKNIVRNDNHRPTRMFFMRDREKFIFNYWVKAETSGIVTAVGVKKDRKYLKKYNKVAKKYSLPKR